MHILFSLSLLKNIYHLSQVALSLLNVLAGLAFWSWVSLAANICWLAACWWLVNMRVICLFCSCLPLRLKLATMQTRIVLPSVDEIPYNKQCCTMYSILGIACCLDGCWLPPGG
jgi:hypothetical protein